MMARETKTRLVTAQYATTHFNSLVVELENGLDVVYVQRGGETCLAMVSADYMKYIDAVLGTTQSNPAESP